MNDGDYDDADKDDARVRITCSRANADMRSDGHTRTTLVEGLLDYGREVLLALGYGALEASLTEFVTWEGDTVWGWHGLCS